MVLGFGRKRENAVQALKEVATNHTGIYLTEGGHTRQLQLIDLKPEDLQRLAMLHATVEQNIGAMIDTFYDALKFSPTLVEIIQKNSTIDRLKSTLRSHVLDIFTGRIDEKFIEKRRSIAIMHVRIGLYPKWYIAAFQNLFSCACEIIYRLNLSREEERAYVLAVGKIFNFEQQIVLEEFDKYADHVLQEEQEHIRGNVRKTIGSIANDLEYRSTDTSQAVDRLVHGTEAVQANLNTSIQDSNETKAVSEKGSQQMNVLREHNVEIDQKTSEMSDMVMRLASSSNEIQEVIQIVKNIADQTNLLALNSAIEAARAGEYGQGFAVVADEVRKLADQTKQSVEQISSLIDVSGTVTDQVVHAIQEIRQLVEEGLSESERSIESFAKITQAIEVTIQDFEQVAQEIGALTSVVGTIDQSSTELLESSRVLDETVRTF